MAVNLRNMPTGKLYEFADGYYIWKIFRVGGTRGGNYLSSLERGDVYTEVFSFGKDGQIHCEWSGRLTENPGLYGENGLNNQGCFHIFSYDQDCGRSYKQEKDLAEAPEDLQRQALAEERDVIKYIKLRLDEQKKGRRF